MNQLPILKSKTHFMELPSTGKRIKFHSMNAGMEKRLALIKDAFSKEFIKLTKGIPNKDEIPKDLVPELAKLKIDMERKAFEIVSECFPDISMNDLTEGDFEVLQVRLREVGVGSKLNISTECPKCKNSNKTIVSLSDVKIKTPSPEKEIVMDDGSILVIGHISMMDSLNNIDVTDDVSSEYNNYVNSFRRLRYKNGNGSWETYDMKDIPFDHRCLWAESIPVKQKSEIEDFLKDSPGMEPLEIKINSCKGKILDGTPLTKQQIKDIPKENPEIIDQIEECGHTYSTKIFKASDYFSN